MTAQTDNFATAALLDRWRDCTIAAAWPDPHVHALHCYFNTCPESPDGRRDPVPRHGTTSWRPAHPHPVFSHDGRRVYFNANLGPHTVLHVATRGE